MEELELKHITPYLPYSVEVVEVVHNKVISDSFVIDMINFDGGNVGGEDAVLDSFESERAFSLYQIKPILRSLSSMTKEEAYDLLCLIVGIEDIGFEQSDLDYISLNYKYDMLEIKGEFPFDDYVCGTEYTINISNDGIACFDTESNGMYIPHSAYDYLLSKHFDIFGLIDEGLAIEK